MGDKILLFSVFVFLFAGVVFGQTGKVFKDAQGGFSFKAPAGFQVTSDKDGYALNERSGNLRVLVVKHPYSNAEQFAESVDLGEYGLALDGIPKQVNDTDYSFKAEGLTEQGRVKVDAYAMFSPNGGGLVILAIATSSKFGQTLSAAKAVFVSVRFFKPELSGLVLKAREFLAGKTLTKRAFRSNYSEEFVITLCRNGTYQRRARASGSPGPTYRTASQGRWNVVGSGGEVYLILNSTQGKTLEYELGESTSSLKLQLNQAVYSVGDAGC